MLLGFSKGRHRKNKLVGFSNMSGSAVARIMLYQFRIHKEEEFVALLDTNVQVAIIPCSPHKGELKVLGLTATNYSLPASTDMAFNYVRSHVEEISACLGMSPVVDSQNLVRLDRKGYLLSVRATLM